MTDVWASPAGPEPQRPVPDSLPGATRGAETELPAGWDPFTGAAVPPRARRRPRTAWFVSAGVAAVVVIAVIGGLILGRDNRPAAEDAVAETVRVADIPAEPTVAWTVDLNVGVEPEYFADATVVAVGDDQALVIPEYDDKGKGGYPSSLWNPGQVWYEGYDPDYDAGFEAGLLYLDELDKYGTGERTTFPTMDEWWPFEGSFYDEPSIRSGFVDGFRDAETDAGRGAHKLRVPASTEYVPTAMLIDLTDGEIIWQTDLSDHLADYERSVYFEALDVPGADYLVVNAVVTDSDKNVVLTLDKVSGDVIDAREYDAYTWAFVDVDDSAYYVLEHDWASGQAVLKRYDGPSVSSPATWWTRCEGDSLLVDHGTVFVYGGTPTAVNAETGVPTSLSRQFSSDDFFFSVGDHLLRARVRDSGSLRLTEVDESGDKSWRTEVEATYLAVVDGMLFVGDRTESTEDHDIVTNLMRIDPDSGTEMWDEPFAHEIFLTSGTMDGGLGQVDGRLAVSEPDGTRTWTIDLTTGEASPVHGQGFTIAFGVSQYFTVHRGNLAAYSPSTDAAVWTYALEDDEYPSTLGAHLVVFDAGDGDIIGLN